MEGIILFCEATCFELLMIFALGFQANVDLLRLHVTFLNSPRSVTSWWPIWQTDPFSHLHFQAGGGGLT